MVFTVLTNGGDIRLEMTDNLDNPKSPQALALASGGLFKQEPNEISAILRLGSCAALFFCSVAATLFTEASKSHDGSYPYDPFMVPCTVEAVKLCVSTVLLVSSRARGDITVVSFSNRKFFSFSLPALCYYISNNCMFYIIRELGPTTFQITNNLKVLSTGILMRVFLGRKLTWLKWKALMLLVLGAIVTQLESGDAGDKNTTVGYAVVLVNSFFAGAGGVFSEKLLKGKEDVVVDHIHWQNMQLYFFGFIFGLMTLAFNTNTHGETALFSGFNKWAYATVTSLSMAGLLVSFILKYLDNLAKCFVAAVSIIFVAIIHATVQREAVQMKLVIGIILTCMALEQYNLPQ